MFNKEEIQKMQKQLEELDAKYQSGIKEIKEFQESKFKKLDETFQQLREKQFFYFDEYEKSIAAFNDMNLRYRKEFDALNLIKNNMSSKVLEKLEKEIKEELKNHFGKLEGERLKFIELSKNLERAKTEINRLACYAEKIKSADFELTRHAQELKNTDDEKLRLMKQVDELQTLVAKIRQGRHS